MLKCMVQLLQFAAICKKFEKCKMRLKIRLRLQKPIVLYSLNCGSGMKCLRLG